MLKFLLASMFVGVFSFNFAHANEAFDASQAETAYSTQVDQQDFILRPPGGRHPGGRGFLVQWRDVNSGQSISGWVQSDRPVCGHGAQCACGGQNYCGEYGRGQQALYWDRGCGYRPRTIVCDVQ